MPFPSFLELRGPKNSVPHSVDMNAVSKHIKENSLLFCYQDSETIKNCNTLFRLFI